MRLRRYCNECGELTRPAWLRDWLTRYPASCSQCRERYDEPAYYDCPGCGWPTPDDTPNDPSWVGGTEPRDYGFDGGLTWTEYHKCPECGTEWDFVSGT